MLNKLQEYTKYGLSINFIIQKISKEKKAEPMKPMHLMHYILWKLYIDN